MYTKVFSYRAKYISKVFHWKIHFGLATYTPVTEWSHISILSPISLGNKAIQGQLERSINRSKRGFVLLNKASEKQGWKGRKLDLLLTTMLLLNMFFPGLWSTAPMCRNEEVLWALRSMYYSFVLYAFDVNERPQNCICYLHGIIWSSWCFQSCKPLFSKPTFNGLLVLQIMVDFEVFTFVSIFHEEFTCSL